MQTKAIKLGTSYVFKTRRYDRNPDRAWVLSRDTYREDTYSSAYRNNDPRFVQQSLPTGRRSGSGHRYDYGLLVLKVSGYAVKELTPEVVALLDKVTAQEVVVADGVPTYVRDAFAELNDVTVEVKVVQSRYIIDQWDVYAEADRKSREAQQQHALERQAIEDDHKARMTEVVQVLNWFLGKGNGSPLDFQGPYEVSEWDNTKLTVSLEDLEAVVEALKDVLPMPQSS